LCAIRRRGRRISATIALVVVFPFVAETSTDPSGSLRARRSIGARIQLPEQLSGQRRAAAAAGKARERARGARGRGLERERERRAHAANRTRPDRGVTRSSEFAPPADALPLAGEGRHPKHA